MFGTEGGVIDLKLLHCSDRGLKRDGTIGEIVERDPINNVVSCFLSIARGCDRERSQPPDRR